MLNVTRTTQPSADHGVGIVEAADPSTVVVVNGLLNFDLGIRHHPMPCRCKPALHQLLALAAADRNLHVSDMSPALPATARAAAREAHRLRLGDYMTARQTGWPAGSWLLTLTPAGLAHAADVAGTPDIHLIDGGGWGPGQRSCTSCGQLRPLTDMLAINRLAGLPPGADRDAELRASSYVCPTHGFMRAGQYTTKKTCGICADGLVRLVDPLPVD